MMSSRSKLLRRLSFWVLGLAVTVGVVISVQAIAPAQSAARLDTRIFRLDAEISSLSQRVSRLESQLSQVGRGPTGGNIPAPNVAPPNSTVSAIYNDPAYERLATLIIETRDAVASLEDRLEAVEARLGS